MKRQIGSRPLNPREPEKERTFWEKYWKTLGEQRVRPERFIWHERAVQRFIRFISPKRLRECDSKDVSDMLGEAKDLLKTERYTYDRELISMFTMTHSYVDSILVVTLESQLLCFLCCICVEVV